MTYQDPKAIYVCINHGEAHASKKIAERVMCINKDLQKVTEDMGWTYAQVVCPQKLYIWSCQYGKYTYQLVGV